MLKVLNFGWWLRRRNSLHYPGLVCNTKVSKSSEFAGIGSAVGFWLVSQGISKSSEFRSVGSAVSVGFDYPGLACILKISKGCWVRRRGWL